MVVVDVAYKLETGDLQNVRLTFRNVDGREAVDELFIDDVDVGSSDDFVLAIGQYPDMPEPIEDPWTRQLVAGCREGIV